MGALTWPWTSMITGLLPPRTVGDGGDEPEFVLLLCAGERVAVRDRGEPALSAQRQLGQGLDRGGLGDPCRDRLGILELPGLRRQQAEDHHGSGPYVRERLERTGPLRVVLQQQPVEVEPWEQLAGDSAVPAGRVPSAAGRVAAADVQGPRHARDAV